MKTRKSASKKFSTLATLHRGFSYMPGELKLSNGRLSFTAHQRGEFWTYQLRALERDAHQPGLAQKLAHGEAVQVFDVPVRDVVVSFNRLGGMKLTTGDLSCRISFYDLAIAKEIPDLSDSPTEAAVGLVKGIKLLPRSLSESSTALARAAEWKALLMPASKE
jgi:hypothetical protein